MTYILKSILSIILVCQYCAMANCQIQPVVKTGVNFGFINKKRWVGPGSSDQYEYGQPLIRPIIAIGIKHSFDKISLAAGIMYQTKGQGTKVPRVRNFFQSVSPDAIHFLSFPFGIEYEVFKKLDLTLSIQPSMFLGGVDNYYAGEYWRSWIWSNVLGLKYSLSKTIEIGFEYDHDLMLYYCPECNERFLTYRVYTSFPVYSSDKY